MIIERINKQAIVLGPLSEFIAVRERSRSIHWGLQNQR